MFYEPRVSVTNMLQLQLVFLFRFFFFFSSVMH